jgi:hypothetical protein
LICLSTKNSESIIPASASIQTLTFFIKNPP